MNKSQIEYKIRELKMDYMRVQGDIEKLESTGHGVSKAEERLVEMEKELKELNKLLLKAEK
ncbi:SE1832 family protein [Domibacillus sp. DTU_2020_1001157_1_SI_ALB_TIR_016]|uniref:SE1832 family protein n=1 Tax=Domibacillus sp. DTU_2020_1001157_1_SI_ALB_TIR_016 TaxID=3077789 RepID=UPI0028E2278E|nr:SE1832 family protein [Domibacillus sp. DTU_2020_1001157_1_SI_ALB_TIR_016]WNS80418.1 SE1832 family protein [Domibacillus sp. DTU_2020_1001157_1_SI_ALB_TIR_016]